MFAHPCRRQHRVPGDDDVETANQPWFYGSQYGRLCSRIDFDRAPTQIDVARSIGYYTYFLLVQVTKCVRVAAHSATDIRTVDHRTADRLRDRGFVD